MFWPLFIAVFSSSPAGSFVVSDQDGPALEERHADGTQSEEGCFLQHLRAFRVPEKRVVAKPCHPRGNGICADLPAWTEPTAADGRVSFVDVQHHTAARRASIPGSRSWAAVPAAGAGPAPKKIMFGSCNTPDDDFPYAHPADQSFWGNFTSAGEKPDLMILAGDSVYGHCSADDCDNLAQSYERLASAQAFRRFAESVPLLAMWDDWDYGVDDGDRHSTGKEVSKQLFMDFFDAPEGHPRHTPGRGQPGRGIEASYMVGPEGQEVQIILLDMRWYRDSFRQAGPDLAGQPGTERYVHDADIAGTMLGEEQWQWFKEELARPARLRLVVSGIQLLSESHGFESWSCLPSERSRMLDLLQTASPTPVVISGDRHMGGAYRISGSSEIMEFTASSFTHSSNNFTSELELQDPLRVSSVVGDNNVGLVEIDWDHSVAQISLRRIWPSGAATDVYEIPL